MESSEVAAELQRIYEQRGELTPTLVTEEAKAEEHPLHSHFEWDDSIAGKKYRLLQAAALIRSVKVVYKETPTGPKDLRAWVNVRESDGRGGVYKPVGEVVEDEFSRNLVLRQMEREWRLFKARYENFEEFAAMVLRDVS